MDFGTVDICWDPQPMRDGLQDRLSLTHLWTKQKENNMHKRTQDLWKPILCGIVLLGCIFSQPTMSGAFDISIQASPSTLNIQSMGEVVTVHTSIAYSSVIGGSVTLNGIPISWWKADNQGNFVAKFEMGEVKALADTGDLQVPGENMLTLIGQTKDGATFTGETTITVIDVQPVGGGKR